MKKLLSIGIILVIFLPMLAYFNDVRADSSVGGVITSNTTWGQAASPYKLTDDVVVNEGVTLTIEAGAIVDFDNHNLESTVLSTLKEQTHKKYNLPQIILKATSNRYSLLILAPIGTIRQELVAYLTTLYSRK